MAEKKSYSEKLKDPRWQKKRLEILSRDNFTCRLCGDNKETLHVHHLKYYHGREPWDYEGRILLTECESCHKSEHESRQKAESDLIEVLRLSGFSASDVENLSMMVEYNDASNCIRSLLGHVSLVCGLNDKHLRELSDFTYALFQGAVDANTERKMNALD